MCRTLLYKQQSQPLHVCVWQNRKKTLHFVLKTYLNAVKAEIDTKVIAPFEQSLISLPLFLFFVLLIFLNLFICVRQFFKFACLYLQE